MKYQVLFLLICIVACQQPKHPSTPQTKPLDGFAAGVARQDSVKEQMKKQNIADSLELQELLAKALKYAVRHINSAGYKKTIANPDSTDLSKLTFGRLFTDDGKYLIVEIRLHSLASSIDLYIWNGKHFAIIKQIELDAYDFDYLGSEIKDIDGDLFKDFTIYTYPMSGCCRRVVSWVYRYQQKGKFSQQYEFLNPTFSPKEKLIRGIEYGHPGEVPLYKFKWNGLSIDTLEYIYRADTLGKKFYRVRHRFDNENPSTRKLLNTLPREYRKIESIEWFLMNE